MHFKYNSFKLLFVNLLLLILVCQLSYAESFSSSSSQVKYGPELAMDLNDKTSWCAENGNAPADFWQVEFDKSTTIGSIHMKSGLFSNEKLLGHKIKDFYWAYTKDFNTWTTIPETDMYANRYQLIFRFNPINNIRAIKLVPRARDDFELELGFLNSPCLREVAFYSTKNAKINTVPWFYEVRPTENFHIYSQPSHLYNYINKLIKEISNEVYVDTIDVLWTGDFHSADIKGITDLNGKLLDMGVVSDNRKTMIDNEKKLINEIPISNGYADWILHEPSPAGFFLGGTFTNYKDRSASLMSGFYNFFHENYENYPILGTCGGHQTLAMSVMHDSYNQFTTEFKGYNNDPSQVVVSCGINYGCTSNVCCSETEAKKISSNIPGKAMTNEFSSDRYDMLFNFLDKETGFKSHLGHSDYVNPELIKTKFDIIGTYPKEVLEINKENSCLVQAAKIKNSPAYGTQFHWNRMSIEKSCDSIAYDKEVIRNMERVFKNFILIALNKLNKKFVVRSSSSGTKQGQVENLYDLDKNSLWCANEGYQNIDFELTEEVTLKYFVFVEGKMSLISNDAPYYISYMDQENKWNTIPFSRVSLYSTQKESDSSQSKCTEDTGSDDLSGVEDNKTMLITLEKSITTKRFRINTLNSNNQKVCFQEIMVIPLNENKEICNTFDDDFDGFVDEGCDDDNDTFWDSDMICSGRYLSFDGRDWECKLEWSDADDSDSGIHHEFPLNECNINVDCEDNNICTINICTTEHTCDYEQKLSICPNSDTITCGQQILPTNNCGTCSGIGTKCGDNLFCQQGICSCTGYDSIDCTTINGCAGKKDCVDGLWSDTCEPTGYFCDTDCDGVSKCSDIQCSVCDCIVGDSESESCGSDVGECVAGTRTRTCQGGSWEDWTTCQGKIDPTTETCDGLDNDCDGETDEDCDCTDGDTQQCENQNSCPGEQLCDDGVWQTCISNYYYCDTDCDGTNKCSLTECVPCAEPECSVHEDCDDNNVCTTDICDSNNKCSNIAIKPICPTTEETTCGETITSTNNCGVCFGIGNLCSKEETCIANSCVIVDINDIDNDGINDEDDNLIGDGSFIVSNLDDLIVLVNNEEVNNSDGLKSLKIINNNMTINFKYNFTNNPLILSDIKLVISKIGYGGIYISDLILKEDQTKNITFFNINNITSICIKDLDNTDFSEISSLCNEDDEIALNCPETKRGYSCKFTDSTKDFFFVSGLKHSAIKQQTYCGDGNKDSEEECDGNDFGSKTCASYNFDSGNLKCNSRCVIDTSSCTKTTISTGGGSSSTDDDWICETWSSCIGGRQTQKCIHKTKDIKKTNNKVCDGSCSENWTCISWDQCDSDGLRRRNCADQNKCGSSINKPKELETCLYLGNCNDNIKNNNEEGIDCGEVCDNNCSIPFVSQSNINLKIAPIKGNILDTYKLEILVENTGEKEIKEIKITADKWSDKSVIINELSPGMIKKAHMTIKLPGTDAEKLLKIQISEKGNLLLDYLVPVDLSIPELSFKINEDIESGRIYHTLVVDNRKKLEKELKADITLSKERETYFIDTITLGTMKEDQIYHYVDYMNINTLPRGEYEVNSVIYGNGEKIGEITSFVILGSKGESFNTSIIFYIIILGIVIYSSYIFYTVYQKR